MKPQWLNRSLVQGPYYTLVLSEADFHRETRRLKQPPVPWIKTARADATTHHYVNKDGNLCVIVALRDHTKHSPISVAGLLVHEAVHIWQAWCEGVGEQRPGDETEAYAIQWISQELMAEFVRQTGGKT